MDFHFFTEPSKISPQTSNQAFGVINENEYKLENNFYAVPATTPKAFAVTGGVVLVQKILDSDLYTITLKPTLQPDLGLPKIEYIIYKGIKGDSLLNGDLVANSQLNDLNESIHESTSLWYQNLQVPIPNSEPNAERSLGLIYNVSDSQNEYYKEDTALLDEIFYSNDDITLPTVNAGNHIGDFDNTSEIGIIIITEKIGYRAPLKLARELNSVLSFTPLDANASHAQMFERKHQKEGILAYLDATAFFGSFYNLGLKASEATTVNTYQGENLYQSLLLKHYNKNKIYVDIRNECDDSFNYYENYNEIVPLSSGSEETFSDINYYRDSWPLLRLDNSEFATDQPNKTIKLSLYKGDNYNPQFYLKKGDINNLDDNIAWRFLEADETESSELHYKIMSPLLVNSSVPGDVISNYILLKYIRRFTTPDQQYQGLSLKKESYLDNIFPLFDMHIPYVNQTSVDVKVFADLSYIDKSNINGIDYTTNIGLARDPISINFISFPQNYNTAEVNEKALLPLYSEQSFATPTFVTYLNQKINSRKINAKVYETVEDDYDFLSFTEVPPEDEDFESGIDANDVASTENIYLQQPDLFPEFDFENVNILSLTVEQFNNLAIVKDAEFTPPYKVYLGVTNTEYYTESKNSYASTYFSLRGLKINEVGELVAHEFVTDIKVFAEDDLYNFDVPTENARVLDAFWADVNANRTTKAPYNTNTMFIRVKSTNAVGKSIHIECKHNMNLHVDPVKLSLQEEVISNDMIISFKITPAFFGEGSGENIKEFYLNIKIGDGDYKEYCNTESTRLRIHVIRFVPNLCKKRGWLQALAAQDYWFTHSPNSNMNTVNPLLNLYPLSWAKGFSRALEKFNELKDTKWNTATSITSLKNEINKMINANLVAVPTGTNPTTQFNTFSDEIVNHSPSGIPLEKVPLFEKYYYTGINQETDLFSDPIDDLLATLGSFNWHAAARGTLQHVNNTTMKVTITKLRIYIKDNFDFTEGSTTSNYLGEWNFLTNDVQIAVFRPAGYYTLNNEDYHIYRNEHNKGYDHHRYSIPEDIDKNYVFNMPKP